MIEWDLHVPEGFGAYDMIIGRDILSGLGIKFDFTDVPMEWGNMSIPMKDTSSLEQQMYYIPDTAIVEEATERRKAILDARYEKADLLQLA